MKTSRRNLGRERPLFNQNDVMENFAQSTTMDLATLVGGIAFAYSGFLAGTRKNLDWMGLLILAFLTANGGGILRDLLTNQPPLAVLSSTPFALALGVTALGIAFRLHRRDDAAENRWLFVICDAVGLVAFAITGSLVALDLGIPFFGHMALAFLTATGGAILRDVLVNEVPAVLHSGFYGSVALLVGAGIYGLHVGGAVTPASLAAVFTGGLLLRLVAYKRGWQLPRL